MHILITCLHVFGWNYIKVPVGGLWERIPFFFRSLRTRWLRCPVDMIDRNAEWLHCAELGQGVAFLFPAHCPHSFTLIVITDTRLLCHRQPSISFMVLMLLWSAAESSLWSLGCLVLGLFRFEMYFMQLVIIRKHCHQLGTLRLLQISHFGAQVMLIPTWT